MREGIALRTSETFSFEIEIIPTGDIGLFWKAIGGRASEEHANLSHLGRGTEAWHQLAQALGKRKVNTPR